MFSFVTFSFVNRFQSFLVIMKAEIQLSLKSLFPGSFEEERSLEKSVEVQKVVLVQEPIPPPPTENASKSQDETGKSHVHHCEIKTK